MSNQSVSNPDWRSTDGVLLPPELDIEGEYLDPSGNIIAFRVLPEAVRAHDVVVRRLLEELGTARAIIHLWMRHVIDLAKAGRIDTTVACELFGLANRLATEEKLDIDWAEHLPEVAALGSKPPLVKRFVRPAAAEMQQPALPPEAPSSP